MQYRVSAALVVASLFITVADASAQPATELTLPRALELARDNAPRLMVMRARVAASRSGIDAAAVMRTNPEVGLRAGPRIAADGVVAEGEVELMQPVRLGRARHARVDVAQLAVREAEASLRDQERVVLRDMARTFAELLYWQRRLALAEENLVILTEVAEVARRRHDVGEAGGLERSVAALARSGAESEVALLRASQADAQSRLKLYAGMAPNHVLDASGELDAIVPLRRDAASHVRADAAAADAAMQTEQAHQRLARTARVPRLSVGAAVGREESATIARGIVQVTLPFFDRGQGELAVASAALELAGVQRRAVGAHIASESFAARERAELLQQARQRFEEEGMLHAEDAEQIATASYRAGAIGVSELLTVRRELLAVRHEFVNLRLQAALARIDVWSNEQDLIDNPSRLHTDRRER